MIDLLVVGAGPVGLTAALEVRRLGLSARIIDRKLRRSSNDSRALVVHPRVAELLRPHAYVVENVLDRSTRMRRVSVHFAGNDGNCNNNIVSSASPLDAAWGDTEYPFFSLLPQYDTERIVEEALGLRLGDDEVGGGGKGGGGAAIKVEYGTSIDDLNQNDDFVTTTIAKRSSSQGDGGGDEQDQKEVVTSRFVLGCDGGRSKTRDLVGVDMNRSSSKAYFVVADIKFGPGEVPITGGGDSGDEIHVFFHSSGTLAFFPLPGSNTFRVFALCPEGATEAADVDLDDPSFFDNLVRERTNGMQFPPVVVGEGDGRWRTVFEITHGVSDSFRSHRVFLAGDAAHVHSPVGGQGMNYGMQDAVNLIWKLAWTKRCCRDDGSDNSANTTNSKTAVVVDKILNSYETERHTMGEGLIKYVEYGTMMITTRNWFLQTIRNALLRILYWANVPAKRGFAVLGQLQLSYSPSSSDFILEAPSSSFLQFWNSASSSFICQPGQRLPNLRLSDGTVLYDHIDRERHTWVFLNTGKPGGDSLLEKDGVKSTNALKPAVDSQSSNPPIDVKTLTKPQVLLVRPDLFVAGIDSTYTSLRSRLLEKQAFVDYGEEFLATM